MPENRDGRWLAIMTVLLLLFEEGLEVSYIGKSCKEPARLITMGSGTLISGAVLISKSVVLRSAIPAGHTVVAFSSKFSE